MIENNNTEQSSYQATYAPKFVKMKGVVRFVCLLVLSVTMLTAGNAKVPSQAPPVCAYSCPVHAWVESLPHPVGANGVVKVEAHGSLYHLCPEAEVNVMLDAKWRGAHGYAFWLRAYWQCGSSRIGYDQCIQRIREERVSDQALRWSGDHCTGGRMI